MSEAVTLAANAREGRGSRVAGKLRKQGLLPGIVYGHKQDPVAVTVNYSEFDKAVRIKHARVLDLSLGGKTETVLIRDVQWDHLGDTILHADFARIDKNEKVRVTVPVKLKNVPKTTGGGVLDQPFHTLHIECLAVSIPDDISIDITNLTLGNPIHVRELTLPSGVSVLEGPETVVVQLKLPGQEPAVVIAPPAEGGSGPEIIKKEKKTEDADEK